MKKIDFLIIKSFIGPFIVTFFIALFVLIMQFLWKYIDDLVGKGLEMSVIGELIFFMSASIVPLALPIAILLSSIMTFGQLGEHYELVSLKSAGISLVRFMMPLLVTAIILSGASFAFANYVLPVANMKFAALLYSVTKQKPALNIRPGEFYNGIEGYVIRVASKAEDNRTVFNVKIHDHTDKRGNINVLLADKGEMYTTPGDSALIFKLFNGTRYEEPNANKRSANAKKEFIRTHFEEYEMTIDLANLEFQKTDEALFRNNQRMLNVKQLLTAVDSMENRMTDRHQNFYSNMKPHFAFIKDTSFFNPNKKLKQDTAKKEPTKSTVIKIGETSGQKAAKERARQKVILAEKAKKRLLDKTNASKDKDKLANNKTKPKTSGNKQKTTPPKKPEVFMSKEELLAISPFLGTVELPKARISSISKRATNLARNVKSYSRVSERQNTSDTKKINRYMIEVHAKMTLSLACLVLFLIGAPLGAIIRKGGLGMPMVLAILFFTIYHVISTMGKKFAEETVMSPFAGIWLSTFILVPLGIFLIYKATNDSQIFNARAYSDFFKQIGRKLKLVKAEN